MARGGKTEERKDGGYREEKSHKKSSSGSRNQRGKDSRCSDGRDIRKFRDHKDTKDSKEYGKDRNHRDDSDKVESKRNRTKDYKSNDKRGNRQDDALHSARKSSRDDERTHHKERKIHREELKNNREERYRHDKASLHRHASSPRNRRQSPDNRIAPNSDRQGRHESSRYYRKRNSRSRSYSRERLVRPLDRARLSALEMERKLNLSNDSSEATEIKQTTEKQPSRTIVPLMSLPLSDIAPKQPNVIAIASSLPNAANNSEPDVIQLPSYYNPSVINPSKYAEQQQKRKLLWGAKKAEDTAAKWGHAHFSQDSDGKVASKFMRLMGIKGAAVAPTADTIEVQSDAKTSPPSSSLEPLDIKKREAMFSKMEQQYEVARQVTHTMRGVGLGFSSQPRTF